MEHPAITIALTNVSMASTFYVFDSFANACPFSLFSENFVFKFNFCCKNTVKVLTFSYTYV